MAFGPFGMTEMTFCSFPTCVLRHVKKPAYVKKLKVTGKVPPAGSRRCTSHRAYAKLGKIALRRSCVFAVFQFLAGHEVGAISPEDSRQILHHEIGV